MSNAVTQENVARMGEAANAMYTTIITTNGNAYQVDHTLEEVFKMIEDARRRQVGHGEQRQHVRRMDVVFRRIIEGGKRADSQYREAVVVNVDHIVEYYPLDEAPYDNDRPPIAVKIVK